MAGVVVAADRATGATGSTLTVDAGRRAFGREARFRELVANIQTDRARRQAQYSAGEVSG
jgi:hypothetical protein